MATSMKGKGVQNAYASVAASQTDSSLVSAVADQKIRVIAYVINQGDTTASSVTFNSKPAGAGTAIYPALKYAANGGANPYCAEGLFETNAGEGLTVTTGAGSTTGIAVTYRLIPG